MHEPPKLRDETNIVTTSQVVPLPETINPIVQDENDAPTAASAAEEENAAVAQENHDSISVHERPRFFTHLRVLLHKLGLSYLRKLKSTLFLLTLPVVLIIMLVVLQFLAKNLTSSSVSHPPVQAVSPLKNCAGQDPGSCVPVLYAPGADWVQDVMRRVANMSAGALQFPADFRVADTSLPWQLSEPYDGQWCVGRLPPEGLCPGPGCAMCNDTEKDFISFEDSVIPVPSCFNAVFSETKQVVAPCRMVRDNTSLVEQLLHNHGTTYNHAVLFQSAYYRRAMPKELRDVWGLTDLKDYFWAYNVFYNSSLSGFPFFQDDDALAVKMRLDAAILLERAKQRGGDSAVSRVDVDIKWARFPKPVSRLKSFDIVAEFGGLWFFLPALATFHFILMDVVTEKDEKRRLGLRMMGMGVTAFWSAWAVTSFVLSALSATMVVVAGRLAQFNVFVNADPGVLWTLFFTYTWSLSCVGLAVAACTEKVATAQAVSWAVILVGFLFQAMLSIGDSLLINLLHITTLPEWIPERIAQNIMHSTSLLLGVVQLYPPFHMAKGYHDVASVAAGRFDVIRQTFTKPGHFSWKNVGDEHPDFVLFSGYDYKCDLPSLLSTWTHMSLIGVVALVLAWYFEHVLGSRGDGIVMAPWFVFDPRFWRSRCRCCCRRSRCQRSRCRCCHASTRAPLAHSNNGGGEDNSAESGIRLHELRKRFTARPGSRVLCGRRWCCVRCRGCRCWLDCSKHHVDAVDGISAVVPTRTLLGLIGHNGAGKTTLIRMLTGVIMPSHGSASAQGKLMARAPQGLACRSQSGGVSSIGPLIGVCPQQNVLWPEITAEEHLRMFAAVKGIHGSKAAVTLEVEAKLRLVGLLRHRHVRVGRMSGGMQRRLSLAIAVLGDPPVIVLDEPTTGVDPYHRSIIWSVVTKLKKTSTFLLTTHDMNECEVLSDQVAVMAGGKLQCEGTTVALKQQHGSGYYLRVLLDREKCTDDDGAASDWAKEWMQASLKSLPDVVLVRVVADCATLHVTSAHAQQLPTLLRLLGSAQSTGHVTAWDVSLTSLEEVLLAVSTDTQAHSRSNVDDSSTESPAEAESETIAMGAPTLHSADSATVSAKVGVAGVARSTCNVLQALLIKNAQLQRRQWCQNICLVLAPLTALIMVLALNSVVQEALQAGVADGHHGAGTTHENAGTVLLPTAALPLSDFALMDQPTADAFTYLPLKSGDPARAVRWPNIWFGNEQFAHGFGNDCFVYFQIFDTRGEQPANDLRRLLEKLPSSQCPFFNKTETGRHHHQQRTSRSHLQCQSWKSNKPHLNKFQKYHKRHIGCWDPERTGLEWCYTVDQDQEFEFCYGNNSARQPRSFTSTPGFVVEPTHAPDPLHTAQTTFFDIENRLRGLPANAQKRPRPKMGPSDLNALPDGLVVVDAFGVDQNAAQLSYTLSVNDVAEAQYHRSNDFGVKSHKSFSSASDYASSVFAGDAVREIAARGKMMQIMNNALVELLLPLPPRAQTTKLLEEATRAFAGGRRRTASEGFGDRDKAQTHQVISHNKVGCYKFSDSNADDIRAAKKVVLVRSTLWPAYCEKKCSDYPFFMLWGQAFCICLDKPPSRGAIQPAWCRYRCKGTRSVPWFLSECGGVTAGQLYKRVSLTCTSSPHPTMSVPVLDLLKAGEASGVIKAVTSRYAKDQCAAECGHMAATSVHAQMAKDTFEDQVGLYHVYRLLACYWNDYDKSQWMEFKGLEFATEIKCAKLCDSMPNCTGFELSYSARPEEAYCAPWFGVCTRIDEMHDNQMARHLLTAVKHVSPAKNASEARASPLACTDSVFDWHATLGAASCADYRRNRWCIRDKRQQGVSWNPRVYGALRSYDDASGVAVTQACCECGGGVTHPLQLPVPNERATTRDLLTAMLQTGADLPFTDAANQSWTLSFAGKHTSIAAPQSGPEALFAETPMKTFAARTGADCLVQCRDKARHCRGFRFVAGLAPPSALSTGPRHDADTLDVANQLLNRTHPDGQCTLFSLLSHRTHINTNTHTNSRTTTTTTTTTVDQHEVVQLVLTGYSNSQQQSCSAFALKDARGPLMPGAMLGTKYNQSFCLLLDVPGDSAPSWPPPGISVAGVMPGRTQPSTVCIADEPSFDPTPDNPQEKLVEHLFPLLDLMQTNFISTYPRVSPNILLSAMELLDVLLLPIILTLQLPMLSYNLVWERQEGLRSLQRSMGVMPLPYYLAHYVTAVCLYVVSLVPYVAVSYATSMRLFSQTHLGLMLWFLVGCCNATVGMSWLVAAVLPDRRQALVVGLLCVFVGNALGMLLTVGFYGRPLTVLPSLSTGKEMPTLLNVCPIFAVCRIVYLMSVRCAAFFCYDYWPATWQDELARSLWLLHILGLALIFVAAAYDWTQPLTFVGRLRDKCNNKRRKDPSTRRCCTRAHNGLSRRANPTVNLELGALASVDANSSGGATALLDGAVTPRSPGQQRVLQVTDATKIYANGKRAVSNVTLGVGRGEVLGLLGVNGAGKSTLLGLITGRLKPTGGHIRVSGGPHAVGVCPQFEALWSSLSPLEHLVLFARLKGVPADRAPAAAHAALDTAGLLFAQHRRTDSLSGGMKRRLSVAIAMVGEAAQLLVLDEPSTGLDPGARHQLWNMLRRWQAVDPDRSILICTHSTNEAEVLCSRVAVMRDGKVMANDSQLQLKARHGGAEYTLRIDSQQQGLSGFLDSFPSKCLAGTVSYSEGTARVPLHSEHLPAAFEWLLHAGLDDSRLHWSVAEGGLNAVFHSLFAATDDTPTSTPGPST